MIEIIRQLISILRWLVELPKTLELMADEEKGKLENRMDKLLEFVKKQQEAIGMAVDETKKGKTYLGRAYHMFKGSAKGFGPVIKFSRRIATEFEGLKNLLDQLANRSMIQLQMEMLEKLTTRPQAPLFDKAEDQIAKFHKKNPGATDQDAVEALEADPDAIEELGLAGLVEPEVFKAAMDNMEERHDEVMAKLLSYSDKLREGQALSREAMRAGFAELEDLKQNAAVMQSNQNITSTNKSDNKNENSNIFNVNVNNDNSGMTEVMKMMMHHVTAMQKQQHNPVLSVSLNSVKRETPLIK